MPAFAQETLSLFDGTTGDTGTETTLKTSDNLPARIRDWNKYSKSQFIIPAEFLTQMKNGTITAMTFHSTSYSTPYTSASVADVFVEEVNYTAFDNSTYEPKSNGTIVYQGTVTVERLGPTNQEYGEMTITFTTPYKYRGGNLLIGFENTTTAGWKRFLFRGQNVMWHSALSGYSQDGTQSNIWPWQEDFIPWTTFTYTPGSAEPAYEKFYMVGTFNEWNTTEGGGRLELAATDVEGVYEAKGTLEANAEFKVITPNAEGNDWIWLGGIDETGSGHFLITSGLLNQPLSMVDGSNFRMEQGGDFTFRVNKNDMTLTVIPVAAPVVAGDVNGDGEVTSADITALYTYLLTGDDSDIVNGDQDKDGEIASHDVTIVYGILLGRK